MPGRISISGGAFVKAGHVPSSLNSQGAQNWSSYWTHQLNFYELWKVTGAGTMVGLKRGDPLTITGTGLNAIYAVPDTDPYKTRDTDYVFHKSNGDVSTACDGNRLIGYDFPRVIVRYLDVSPYTIEYIGILDTGQSVNNKMRDDFHLSRWWDNTLSLHGVIKGNRGTGQNAWTAESVLPAAITDGNTVGWYLSQDLTTITKDGSNYVSLWKDKLLSGNDLGVIGGKTPLWSTDGILFVHTHSDILTKGFTWTQPEMIYIVMKQVTYQSTGRFFDGFSTVNLGAAISVTGTPKFAVYAGSFLADCSDLAVDTWGILRVVFNGASSKLIVNDLTPITGNAGASNMGGFTLGAAADDRLYSNIQVKEIILRKVADSSGDETAIYNYLKAKYSL